MEPDEPPADKVAAAHAALPTVIVGISDDEAREQEEEIDGQVAMVEALVDGTCGKALEDVVADDQQGCYAPQSVQKFVVWFRVGICGR